MSNTVSNVAAGKPKIGGAIYTAAITATMPTSADAALSSDWTCLGYVSEEGLRNENGPTSEDIKAWGGDPVLSTVTDKPDRFRFGLLEVLNVDVLKFVHNAANVTGTLATGIAVTANNAIPDHHALVVDMVLGKALKRIVVPDSTITGMEEITYSDNNPIMYDVTNLAYPDSAGNTHYEYIKTAATGVTGQ